ncbi:MAG TPA: DUF1501 domain-containing protein, partial [Planctomycetaceae bacterium]|nr:DUF1501 domain-containing protein [Planctomycetaceae bacterium]
MLGITGHNGRDLCDGISRRDILKVGGSAAFGLSLPEMMRLQDVTAAEDARYGGPGFGKAKHVIMLYLQGGPSHLDLWDP